MRNLGWWVVGLLAVVTAAGCVHPAYHVGVMARLYRQGDCNGALERAMSIQDRVPEFTPEKQAHYAIYRGACHLMLGQQDAAATWLGQAQQLRAQYPGAVVGEHAAVLDQSLAALGQQMAPPPPAVQAVPAPAEPPAQQPPPPAVPAQ